MLSLEAPCSQDFWQLQISTEFEKPEYYIGQTVLHRIKVNRGEILHPVKVIGLLWSGIDWYYYVLLPEDHPEFKVEDSEWTEVENWELEAM